MKYYDHHIRISTSSSININSSRKSRNSSWLLFVAFGNSSGGSSNKGSDSRGNCSGSISSCNSIIEIMIVVIDVVVIVVVEEVINEEIGAVSLPSSSLM